MITALAISLYLVCGEPRVVYVEKEGHTVWLQAEMLDKTETNPFGFKFKVHGTKEEIDFHNKVLEELINTNKSMTIYSSQRCQKA